MRRFWAVLLVMVLVVSSGFGWSTPQHFGTPELHDTAMSPTIAVNSSAALDDCCAGGLSHASDSGQCSFQCAPGLWHVAVHEPETIAIVFAAVDAGAETSASVTPFRPPVA